MFKNWIILGRNLIFNVYKTGEDITSLTHEQHILCLIVFHFISIVFWYNNVYLNILFLYLSPLIYKFKNSFKIFGTYLES